MYSDVKIFESTTIYGKIGKNIYQKQLEGNGYINVGTLSLSK